MESKLTVAEDDVAGSSDVPTSVHYESMKSGFSDVSI
jgi:hypothetical protein